MSEHTKGLWRASGDYVVCKIGELSQATICEIYHNEEDAARIVACVNACEGLSNEQLANICLMDGNLANRFKLLLDISSPLGWNRDND
jgi:hypothetical protein